MRPANFLRIRAASSLLEVVIAASVFAVISLSLAQMSVSVQSGVAFSNEQSAAVAAAAEKIESLKALSFDQVLNRSPNPEAFEVVREINNVAVVLAPGAGRASPGLVTITPIADDVARVVVDIHWAGASGESEYEVVWTVVREGS